MTSKRCRFWGHPSQRAWCGNVVRKIILVVGCYYRVRNSRYFLAYICFKETLKWFWHHENNHRPGPGATSGGFEACGKGLCYMQLCVQAFHCKVSSSFCHKNDTPRVITWLSRFFLSFFRYYSLEWLWCTVKFWFWNPSSVHILVYNLHGTSAVCRTNWEVREAIVQEIPEFYEILS